MKRSLSAAALLVAAPIVAFARPISAEPADAGGEPLTMSADVLDLDVQAKTASLAGHVKLVRAGMKVTCARVEVRYDDKPQVVWAKGVGSVVAELDGVRAEAPEVEIDLAARSLSLRGGVRVARGDGWLTAERARFDMATKRVSMTDVKGAIPLPPRDASGSKPQ